MPRSPRQCSTLTTAASTGFQDGGRPHALDRAVATTDLGLERKPLWWRATGALQALLAATAVAGALWLAGLYALTVLRLPGDTMTGTTAVFSAGATLTRTILATEGTPASSMTNIIHVPGGTSDARPGICTDRLAP